MKTLTIYKTSLILSISIFLFSACKKENLNCLPVGSIDRLEWESADCNESFTVLPGGGGTTSTGNQYKYPVFNPNNAYEFIYYKIVKDSGSSVEIDHQIIRYNLLTNQESIILTGTEISGNMAWNKDGWIALKPAMEPFIYLVKDDGSQFSQFSNIPTGNFEVNLTWLKDGNTLLWGGQNLIGTYLKTKKIGDLSEAQMNLGNAHINYEFDVSPNNLLLTPKSNNYLDFNLVDLNQENLNNTFLEYTTQQGFKHGRVNWHVDGERFYVSFYENNGSSHLYEINYKTGYVTEVLENCHKEVVEEAICLSSGKHLMLQKVEREVIVNGSPTSNGNGLIENYSLWLFDLKTRKEARIFN